MPTSLEAATIPPLAPPPPPPNNNDDDNNNGGKKPAPPPQPDLPPPPALRCPRCDSANTKFCYYNNYSLSQPRHFCKTCRRYWTKGGALRNVPIGGGCRKSKKSRSSSAAPRLPSFSAIAPSVIDFSISPYPQNLSILSSNLNRSCGLLDVGPILPAGSPFLASRFTQPFAANGFLGGGGTSVGATGGLVAPTAAATNGGGADSSFLAASIESLSTLNQELHWKLQQQRLTSMIYAGGEGSAGGSEAAAPKPQHIFFQNLDAANPTKSSQYPPHSTAGNNDNDQRASMIGANQWLFDNSFGGGPSGGGSNDGEGDSGANGGGISGGWSHQIPPVCSSGWFEKGFK